MKLNYKRTILVGFAFFLICHFWQAYDTMIPKILTDKFGMSQTWSGVIMALDNILALFMLPLFGALSDRTKSKRGKRTPFIVIGTLVACCAMLLLCFTDAMQTNVMEKVDPFKDHDAALETLWEADPVAKYGGEAETAEKSLSSAISKEQFKAIVLLKDDGKTTTDEYDNYVQPARQAYAAQTVKQSPLSLILFIVVLLILLFAMGIFRSPAVALMPDVTPKPLRSKGNAIINLMGAAGGILVLVLGIVMGTGKAQNSLMGYSVFFMIVTAVMLGSLLVFVLTVKEPAWAREATADYEKYYPEEAKAEPMEETGKRALSKGEKISLILILASVALWFMGYNAVTSKFSVYAVDVLKKDFNSTLIFAQAAAIVSYIPVGLLSSKIGRKRAILIGVAMLTASFTAAAFLTKDTPAWLMTAFFIIAGIGWATINVNSFPMVVELATGSNTGKYTGYYYTASMAAQIVTPIFSGVFLDINMRTLFPYATIFSGLSFVTMLFVRHGDSKPIRKSALEALGEGED